jgi:hypothetical protein
VLKEKTLDSLSSVFLFYHPIQLLEPFNPAYKESGASAGDYPRRRTTLTSIKKTEI